MKGEGHKEYAMAQQTIGLYKGKKVKQYYDTVKGGAREETSGVDAEVLTYLKSILPKSLRRKVVLEVGCGDCRWASWLHRLGATRVIGLDNSQDMLEMAKHRKKQKGLDRLQLIQADIREMPLLDSSVSLVLASFCLMYFTNLEQVLKEIARVLTSGGRLYIATNMVSIHNPDLLAKLQGKVIPIELGVEGQTISLENVVQPLSQYYEGFRRANLVVEIERHFNPHGLSIPPDYKYQKEITLGKAVWKLSKL